MRRPDFIARHARLPHGIVGRIVARITSYETREFNVATVRALGIQPGDRVLEVGCGRGRTLEHAAKLAGEGKVTGVDHAEDVVLGAARRCRRLIAQGRVQLEVADSARLPFPDGSFDKAYAVHTIYFWEDPGQHLRELRRVLAPHGRLAIGVRERASDRRRAFPDSVYTFYDVSAIAAMLRDSGFAEPEVTSAAGGAPDLAIIVAGVAPGR